jgi:hypothetical protein
VFGTVRGGSATVAANYNFTLRSGTTDTTNITRYSSGLGEFRHLGGALQLVTQDSNPLIFATNNVERVRIDASGNLGIGTSTPATALDVNGDVTITDKIIHSGDTNTAIRFPAADTVTVETDGSERLRVTSTGFVGIGTTTPQRILHIATAEPTVLLQTTSAAVDQNRWRTRVNTSGNFLIGTANDAFDAAEEAYQIVRGTGIAVSTHIFSTANTERMRITAAGNVGIGKTNPTVALDVVGGITSTGSIVTSGTSFLMAGQSTSDQNIKVGEARTGSGNSYIDLIGDTTYTGFGTRLIRGSSGANANSSLQHRGTGALSLYAQDAGIVSFSTNATERMRIDASGNLLLGGTATPASAAASLAIFNGTAPTGSVTNGVVLYAEDVSSSSELKVRDEAGNVTTLSPHNFDLIPEGPSEDMAWSYYSERDGKRINVDMLKAIRLLESITGEKLVHIV